MGALDTLRAQLTDVEAELAGLGARRKALEKAATDLRAAIASVEALGDAPSPPPTASRKGRGRASGSVREPRPTVTPDALLEAVRALGGSATVEQLVAQLGLPDGRSLNGARRVAVEAGSIRYEDRTYTVAG